LTPLNNEKSILFIFRISFFANSVFAQIKKETVLLFDMKELTAVNVLMTTKNYAGKKS
jgi:hypothetical protein